MITDGVLLVAGIVLLALGGEFLIRGALGAARRVGISPLLSGLVIVGFGTSAPELVVSVDAALAGKPDIAVGNVVGSNIGNILLILGVTAVILPLGYQTMALRRDAVAMVAASLAAVLLAWGSGLGWFDGLVMVLGLGGYLCWAYLTERSGSTLSGEVHRAEAGEVSVLPSTAWMLTLALVAGLALLIGGSRLLLHGATGLATSLGVPEAVVGLTIVAVGTSLPELSVSVIAALRRHADVAVGNILGSNIFNVLGILGLSALLQPLPFAERVLEFDQWVMLGTAVLLCVFLVTGKRLDRIEGGLLLAGYVGYLVLSFTLFAGSGG